MRSVVVLPAPFGPSRPVISPSRATKLTSSTARIVRPPAVNVLRSDSTSITGAPSGIPAVGAEERRRRREALEAGGVERRSAARIHEPLHQARHATHAHHVVPLPARDQVPGVRERL